MTFQQPIVASIFDNLRTRKTTLIALATLTAILIVGPAAQAQTVTVLHNFTAGRDGAYPEAGLTIDRAGNFYGTTWQGGTGGNGSDGVVFRMSRQGSGWVVTPLHEFQGQPNDGKNPGSRVIVGPDGSLYGTTTFGGQYGGGTVYRLRPSPTLCKATFCPWQETVLYSFCSQLYCTDGTEPGPGNLVFDGAGNLYGTTIKGGASAGPQSPGYGLVFELTPAHNGWTESVLWSFSESSQGWNPYGALIFDSAGNLYGTTGYQGAYGSGTVYELSPFGSGWTEQTLASINLSQAHMYGGVVMDGRGNLFGASGCGDSAAGQIFELTPSNGGWTLNVLYNFPRVNEGPCDTPTLDAAGNIYGTAYLSVPGYGTVWEITP